MYPCSDKAEPGRAAADVAQVLAVRDRLFCLFFDTCSKAHLSMHSLEDEKDTIFHSINSFCDPLSLSPSVVETRSVRGNQRLEEVVVLLVKPYSSSTLINYSSSLSPSSGTVKAKTAKAAAAG